MRYTINTLKEYCSENNIELINTDNYISISRDNFIEGKCIHNNCNKKFYKKFRQLVETGGYCKECTKNISNNKIIISKLKYNVGMLLEFCNNNKILLSSDYSNIYVNRDTLIEGKCLNNICNNNFIKPFRQLLKINGYCQNCSKENGKIKIKQTAILKYGVENPMQNKIIKEKQKNTMIYKYGVEHNSQLDIIKTQKKEKSLEKYGVEYVLQSSEIREKIKHTTIKKYGVENPMQNNEIKNKTIQTNLIKYGVNSYLETDEFRNKTIQTNLIKYGVSHHSQNKEIANKMLKNSYNKKQYIFPSGKIVDYQGYENFALDELINIENIHEDDIMTNRNDVPEIWYNDKNNKKRRHFVDLYIKSQNRCIEVKSTWTNQLKNNVFEKQTSAKKLGFNYDIWIFDKMGNKIETY
jgi:hypothetical protein